jgi:hypothetical protein
MNHNDEGTCSSAGNAAERAIKTAVDGRIQARLKAMRTRIGRTLDKAMTGPKVEEMVLTQLDRCLKAAVCNAMGVDMSWHDPRIKEDGLLFRLIRARVEAATTQALSGVTVDEYIKATMAKADFKKRLEKTIIKATEDYATSKRVTELVSQHVVALVHEELRKPDAAE